MIAQRGPRLAALLLAAVAGVGLWQSLKLDRWGFDGPDAGFFPQLVAVICIALALVVAWRPGRAGADDDGGAEAPDEGGIVTRDVFGVYCAALALLALGTAVAGFAPTALAVAVVVMRYAERRPWRAALVYGAVCALVGLVLFGWLLRVDLPEGPVERAFFSLVR